MNRFPSKIVGALFLLMSASAVNAQDPFCDENAVNLLAAQTQCGIETRALPAEHPGLVSGTSRYQDNENLFVIHAPVQPESVTGDVCVDMMVCVGPQPDQGYREIDIDSDSSSRNSYWRFYLDGEQAEVMRAKGVESLTVMRVRFRIGGTNDFTDMMITIGPGEGAGEMTVSTIQMGPVLQTNSPQTRTFVGGREIFVNVQSIPGNTHDFSIELINSDYGLPNETIVEQGVNWAPDFRGLIPTQVHYGNIAAEMSNQPGAIIPVVTIEDLISVVGPKFIRPVLSGR